MKKLFGRLLVVFAMGGLVCFSHGCGNQGKQLSKRDGQKDVNADADPGNSESKGKKVVDRTNLSPEKGIQGTWVITKDPSAEGVKIPYKRYMTFSNGKVEMRLRNKLMRQGTYTIDSSKEPPTITTRLKSATTRGESPTLEKTTPFQIEGNTLKLGEGDSTLVLEFVE